MLGIVKPQRHRIFIPETKIIIVRHDVKFMEDKSFIRSRDFPIDDQHKRLIEAPRPSQGKKKKKYNYQYKCRLNW